MDKRSTGGRSGREKEKRRRVTSSSREPQSPHTLSDLTRRSSRGSKASSMRRKGSMSSRASSRTGGTDVGGAGPAIMLETNLKELEYKFIGNPETMDFNEIHQGMLDATTHTKAINVFETMYICSLEAALRINAVNLLTKTQGIVDVITQLLRRYTICVKPFTLTLVALADIAEFGKLFFATAGSLTLLRLFSTDSSMAYAFYRIIERHKAALRSFIEHGGETVLCDYLNRLLSYRLGQHNQSISSRQAESLTAPQLSTDFGSIHMSQSVSSEPVKVVDEGLRGLCCGICMYHLVSMRPLKDAKVHADTTKLVLQHLSEPSTNAQELLEIAHAHVAAQFQNVLLNIVTTIGKDANMAEPFILCGTFGKVLLLRDPVSAAGFLSAMIGMEATSTRLSAKAVGQLFEEAATLKDMNPTLNVYLLHAACRWMHQGWFDTNAVQCAVNAVCRDKCEDAEQEPALHVLISSLKSKHVHKVLGVLNPTYVQPSFDRFVCDTPGSVDGRHLWIIFVHLLTMVTSQNLAAMFKPLKFYIEKKYITEEKFTSFTRWPRNDSQDALTVSHIKKRMKALSGIEGEETEARGVITKEYNAIIEDDGKKSMAALQVLLSDPAYVARMELRRSALEDETNKRKILEDSLVTARDRIINAQQSNVHRIKDQSSRQKETAEKAHKSELEGIVWDPDELALKNATFNTKMGKIQKHADKQIADVMLVSNWQQQLCEQIMQSLSEYHSRRNKELIILEKEEERGRGAGMISTEEWYHHNGSIMAQEAAARDKLIEKFGLRERQQIWLGTKEIVLSCNKRRIETEAEAFGQFITYQWQWYVLEIEELIRKETTPSESAIQDVFFTSITRLDENRLGSSSVNHPQDQGFLLVFSNSLLESSVSALTRAFENSTSSSGPGRSSSRSPHPKSRSFSSSDEAKAADKNASSGEYSSVHLTSPTGQQAVLIPPTYHEGPGNTPDVSPNGSQSENPLLAGNPLADNPWKPLGALSDSESEKDGGEEKKVEVVPAALATEMGQQQHPPVIPDMGEYVARKGEPPSQMVDIEANIVLVPPTPENATNDEDFPSITGSMPRSRSISQTDSTKPSESESPLDAAITSGSTASSTKGVVAPQAQRVSPPPAVASRIVDTAQQDTNSSKSTTDSSPMEELVTESMTATHAEEETEQAPSKPVEMPTESGGVDKRSSEPVRVREVSAASTEEGKEDFSISEPIHVDKRVPPAKASSTVFAKPIGGGNVDVPIVNTDVTGPFTESKTSMTSMENNTRSCSPPDATGRTQPATPSSVLSGGKTVPGLGFVTSASSIDFMGSVSSNRSNKSDKGRMNPPAPSNSLASPMSSHMSSPSTPSNKQKVVPFEPSLEDHPVFKAFWPAVVEGLKGVAAAEARWRLYMCETGFASTLNIICVDEAMSWHRLELEMMEDASRQGVQGAYNDWIALLRSRVTTESLMLAQQASVSTANNSIVPGVSQMPRDGRGTPMNAIADGSASRATPLYGGDQQFSFSIASMSVSSNSVSANGGNIHVVYFKRFPHPPPSNVETQERVRRSKIFDRWIRWWEWLSAVHRTFFHYAPCIELEEQERTSREEMIAVRDQWMDFSKQLWDDNMQYLATFFSMFETERQHRGFIDCNEVIELHQILVYRPRGKRYRPIRDEEVPDKTTQDTQTQNRIKNWIRQIVPNMDPPYNIVEDSSEDDMEEEETPLGSGIIGFRSNESGSDSDDKKIDMSVDSSKLASRLRARTQEAARAKLMKNLNLVELAERARRVVFSHEEARVLRFLASEFLAGPKGQGMITSEEGKDNPLALMSAGPRRSSLSFFT